MIKEKQFLIEINGSDQQMISVHNAHSSTFLFCISFFEDKPAKNDLVEC